MSELLIQLYGAAIHLLPRAFRKKYGSAMQDVFSARIAECSDRDAILLASREIADLAETAARLRLEAVPARRAMQGALTMAVLVVLLAVHERAWQLPRLSAAPADSVAFNATDPAGSFTLTLRHGRAVAATIDNIPIPAARIRADGDSVRVLAPGGGVVLALALDAKRARIAWEPRAESCRGQALTCVRYQ
jgi:hypothetical protein